MLCAYYDKTCDSSKLFEDLDIATDAHYSEYLNQFDVIYLDMTTVMGEAEGTAIVPYIKRRVSEELLAAYPGLKIEEESFSATLLNTVELTGNKFIAIIDEWDAPIRERFVKMENGKVTKNFQLKNSPLSHHHALNASSCPLRCPCCLC